MVPLVALVGVAAGSDRLVGPETARAGRTVVPTRRMEMSAAYSEARPETAAVMAMRLVILTTWASVSSIPALSRARNLSGASLGGRRPAMVRGSGGRGADGAGAFRDPRVVRGRTQRRSVGLRVGW